MARSVEEELTEALDQITKLRKELKEAQDKLSSPPPPEEPEYETFTVYNLRVDGELVEAYDGLPRALAAAMEAIKDGHRAEIRPETKQRRKPVVKTETRIMYANLRRTAEGPRGILYPTEKAALKAANPGRKPWAVKILLPAELCK